MSDSEFERSDLHNITPCINTCNSMKQVNNI